jgi:hypothetical protein
LIVGLFFTMRYMLAYTYTSGAVLRVVERLLVRYTDLYVAVYEIKNGSAYENTIMLERYF